jgi:hypothetical protein
MIKKNFLALFLAFALVLSAGPDALAAPAAELEAAVAAAAAYVQQSVPTPQIGTVGGEWAVIGLARSGGEVPAGYYEAYYRTVEQYVRAGQGVLHEKKYTEYSALILSLTAAGYDPREVGGYDLTLALGDFEKTVWQGVNGPIWALLALDSNNYAIPLNPEASTPATRELYVAEILRRQLADGGWNLTAGTNGPVNPQETSNADLTGMALQALAKYQEQPVVKAATDKALLYLSQTQDATGGYAYGGDISSESVVQVLVGLTELGLAVDDPRFVKNGQTLVDNILSFKNADGSFSHTGYGDGNSQMSTEQALYGLAAARRAQEGKNSLYRMSDAIRRGALLPPETNKPISFPARHAEVSPRAVNAPGRTFADVQGHRNQIAIEKLAERGIISGKSAALFDPAATMTRAEFATIVTRALGLPEKPSAVFTDVAADAWYAVPVGSAHYYGLVAGTSAGVFSPAALITRQEAAVMVTRAAKLAGLATELSAVTIRDTLAPFGDYRSAAPWANSALAFCYAEEILDSAELDIAPTQAVARAEIAEMLYRLLDKAELLK